MAETLNELIRKFAPTDHLAAALVRSERYAREQAQRTILLEHLLLALTEDPDAALVLQASRIDIPLLQSDIGDYLGRLDGPDADWDPGLEAAPHTDLVRIFRVAHAAAQQRNRSASGGLVLAAIVGDGRSPAANMLRVQGLTFEEAVRALQQANARPAKPIDAPVEAADAPRAMPQPPTQVTGFEATRSAAPVSDASPLPQDRQAVRTGGGREPEWRPDPGPLPASGPLPSAASADLDKGHAPGMGDPAAAAPPRMSARPQVYSRGSGPGGGFDDVDGAPDAGPQDDAPVGAPGSRNGDADADWPTSQSAARSLAQAGSRSAGQTSTHGDIPLSEPFPPPSAAPVDRQPDDDRRTGDDADRAVERAVAPAEDDPVRSKLESMHDILAEARRKVEAARPPRRADGAPVRSDGFRPSREQTAYDDRAAAPNLPSADELARLDRARAALRAMEPPQNTTAPRPATDRAPPLRPIDSPNALQTPASRPPPGPPQPPVGDPTGSSAPPPVPSGPPPVRPIGDLNMRAGEPIHRDAPRPRDREAPGDADARPHAEPARTLARHSGQPHAPRPSGNTPALRAPTELAVSAAHARAAKLSNAVPRRLTARRPEMVEVRVPRHSLDAMISPTHVGEARDTARRERIVAKAVSLQLKCDDDGVHVEPVGDQLAWIENRIGTLSDDILCWRWLVTPHASGAAELKLSAMARTVMSDGSAVETVIPPETIQVRVGRNMGRLFGRVAIGALLVALGAAAVLFADPIMALVQQIAGSVSGG